MKLVARRRRGRPRHPDVLMPAEWRVLADIRLGRTNAQIAQRRGISVNTVRTHVSSMLSKLELEDRRALAGWEGRMAEVGTGATYTCSFCRKGESRVEFMIAGPAGVYICDQCVAKCNATIDAQRQKAG